MIRIAFGILLGMSVMAFGQTTFRVFGDPTSGMQTLVCVPPWDTVDAYGVIHRAP
jgi:hypothetical protein